MYNSSKIVGRYFWYHFKETIIRLLVLCLVAFIMMTSAVTEYGKYSSFESFGFVAFLCILAFLLPGIELKEFKNRRNLDLWYQMPISRSNIALVHMLNAIVHVAISYTVGFVATAIRLMEVEEDAILPLFGLYITTLIAFIPLLGYFMFVYDRANSHRDGVILQLAYIYLIPTIILAALSLFLRFSNGDVDYYALVQVILFGPSILIIRPALYFDGLILAEFGSRGYSITSLFELETVGSYVVLVVFILLGIACIFGYYFMAGKTPVNKIQDVSDSWFSYKTLIPVFTISASLLFGEVALYGIITLLVLDYIAFAIYRKSAKISKKDILTIVGLAVFIIGWGAICTVIS